MNKVTTHSYNGMIQDINKSEFPNQFYFEGKNIRVVATDSQSTNAVTNEKGNTLLFEIPKPEIDSVNMRINYGDKYLQYQPENTTIQPRNELERDYYVSLNNYKISLDQIIIGQCYIRGYFILFTTDNNGFDCIWKLDENTYELTLLYLRDLNFKKESLIQALSNYENDIIQKVYWVDGKEQLRFINIKHSIENGDLEELIDLPKDALNSVGDIQLSEPIIQSIESGGTHTAGKIQYAYNLFRINGSQTKISPLSKLVSLTKGNNFGGGDVNELVSSVPVIKISDIDSNYSHIRIYAIKYTSLNQTPSISLIHEREIDSNEITYYDDGSVISTISKEQFLFLGSNIIVPKHINTRKNYMFLANYQEQNFDVDLDCRAYSFNSSQVAKIYNNIYLTTTGNIDGEYINLTVPYQPVPKTFDAVNLNYDTYRYLYNGVTPGGEGKYLKYELITTNENNNNTFFKDNEIYRLGIQFYNRKGQVSLPKWIADFKAPNGNLNNLHRHLKVTLKSEFYIWLNNSANFESEDDKPVGYKILRADRQYKDRTILASGILSSMIVNDKLGPRSDINSNRERSKVIPKLPTLLVRIFQDNLLPVRSYNHLFKIDSIDANPGFNEIQYEPGLENSNTWQYNAMYQMYSPEILFSEGEISLSNNLQIQIKGALKNRQNSFWGMEKPVGGGVDQEGKVPFVGVSPFGVAPSDKYTIAGDVNNLLDHGLISHPGGSDPNRIAINQWYRLFGKKDKNDTTYFVPSAGTPPKYNIYGSPEITETGQDFKSYNNDSMFVYANSLKSLLTSGDDSYDDLGVAGRAIVSVNSEGAKCITFVAGGNNVTDPSTRPTMEQMKAATNISDNDVVLYGEIVKSRNDIYLGNIYGGNSYENKKRTQYVEIGSYKKITDSSITITSPGDTYIGNFKFLRMSQSETRIEDQTVGQYTEIIECTVETTIELTSRNDISVSNWDSKFQPRYSEYHKYNKVYSQQSNLVVNQDVDYKFKKLDAFDTNIIATKVKVPGELIDSWTDLQVNEVLTLDGKYGSINNLNSFNDQLYTFQDSAIAFISTLPRIQVSGNDGAQVELGFGEVLQEYRYLTTESGSKNKWSIINTPSAFYYYDVLNKSINKFSDRLIGLTDTKGMHPYFVNNIVNSDILVDNPVLLKGVSCGYDYLNNDVFFTFLQSTRKFTLAFNESKDFFTSFYDYTPSMYLSRGDKLFTTGPNNKSIYKQYDGAYNTFYGVKYPSYIVLNVNPEPNVDCVFDNINYKSEVYLNGVDQPNITLSKIQAYNEYQNSGLVLLTEGRNNNLRRKFRDWHALIPRQKRERIRNPYIFLKLHFDNNNNYKLILHNINIFYNPNYTI